MRQNDFANATSDYAELADDAWYMSQQLSDRLRPYIPSARDQACELKRYLPAGVELEGNATGAQYYVWGVDPARRFMRQKLYFHVKLDGEDVLQSSVNVDAVRRSIFGAIELLGERIAHEVEVVRKSYEIPRGASVDYSKACSICRPMPIRVWHCGEALLRTPTVCDGDAFAAHDLDMDRVRMRFASYFVVMPCGH